MMTHKQVFSSVCLSLLILSSCKTIKTKLLFDGHNEIGKHSRALFDTEDGFVVGGKDGVYSFFDNDFQQTTDSLKGAEDLRDVHVLGDGSVIFINSGTLGRIWKIDAGGRSKRMTYDRKDVFIDGVDFWDDKIGIAYADPVNGKFVILRTFDGGETWRAVDYNLIPYALPNEGGFAASGTGIATVGESTVYIGTGMADTARLYCSVDHGLSWEIKPTPIKPGDSYGIYSMYFWGEKEGVIVGGSYLKPDDTENLCFYTNDGGDNWIESGEGLGGYTSCIHGTKDGSFLVATGRVATYYSLDRGAHWEQLMAKTFYSVRVTDDQLYFSGKEGVVSVYSYKITS